MLNTPYRTGRYIFFLIIFFLIISFSVRAEVVDEVVAVVNQEIITFSELSQAAQKYFSSADPSRYREVLERLVDQKLIDQATKDMEIKVTEQDIDAMIQSFKENKKISDTQLRDVVAQQGLTWEEYRNELRDGIRRNQAVSQKIRQEVNITEDEIADYYKKNPENFFAPAQVKLEKVFFPFPEPATPEKKKAVLQRAEASLKKITSGADFQKVAQEGSLPDSSPSCDVGVYKKGELTNAIDREAFALKAGEISNVIDTDKGYCIIRVLERTEEQSKKINEVRGAIGNYLFQQKMEDKIQKWLQELRSNAYIDIKI